MSDTLGAAQRIVDALNQMEASLPPAGDHIFIDRRWSDLTLGDLRALRTALASEPAPCEHDWYRPMQPAATNVKKCRKCNATSGQAPNEAQE